MPMQSSGAISLADMNALFALGYSFNSYRGSGSVPASGPISFSQMYGAVLKEPASGDYYSYSGATTGKVTATASYMSYGTCIEQNTSTVWTFKWGGSTIANGNGAGPSSYSSGGWTYYRSSQRASWNFYDSKTSTYYYNTLYGIYRQK